MDLSPIGIIADILWHEIKNHSKNVTLAEFVIMPNHIHGILILNGNTSMSVSTDMDVETRHALSLRDNENNVHFRFRNQGKNTLSSIIGSYKSAVTKHAHRLGFEFEWQSRFHDHIIRDEKSYQTIAA